MKIAVVYHSESGNTEKVAQIVAEGAKMGNGADCANPIEVVLMSIESIDDQVLSEAEAVIFGCPTYCGTFSWQMKRWFDTAKVDLAGKLGSAFATENFVGGGAAVAELGLIGQMLVRGMLVYTAGTSKGKPMTHYGAVSIRDGDEKQKERARLLGRRVAEKALELFGQE